MKSILFCLLLLTAQSWGQTQRPPFQEDLKIKDLEEFKEETKRKVAQFEQYISVIADKNLPMDERQIAIENAAKLFVPGSKMQVSSAQKGKKQKIDTYDIVEYLKRLQALPYRQVDITFYDVAFVGEFRKGDDGAYHTTATIFQEFKGFNDKGAPVYEDQTKKDIDVELRNLFDKNFYDQHGWTVRLGNIKVTETKSATTPLN